ncbi:MAG: hypothetical protein K9N29_03405 [Candidatus Marinimicrobia bacterium]|nr:hypothetical protein [Candidatus Neomarinimicrobiota bacterium]
MHEYRTGTLMKYVNSKTIYRLPKLRTAQIKQIDSAKSDVWHSEVKADKSSGRELLLTQR